MNKSISLMIGLVIVVVALAEDTTTTTTSTTSTSTTTSTTVTTTTEQPMRQLHIRTENGDKIVAYVEEGDFFVRDGLREASVLATHDLATTTRLDVDELQDQNLDQRLTTQENYDANNRLNTLESKTSGLEGLNINDRLVDLESEDAGTRLTSLEDFNLDGRVTVLEDDLPAEVKRIDGVIKTNQDDIGDLRLDLNEVDGRLTPKTNKHESDIISLKTDTNSNTNAVTSHTQDLNNLKPRMKTAENDIDDLETRADDLEDDVGLLKTITQSESLIGMSKERPAPTCSHLAHMPGASTLYKTGTYWIDPDLGSSENAFQAHCDMAKGTTRVVMTRGVQYRNHYTGADSPRWFSIEATYQPIEYAADKSQLQALADSSSHASQELIFQCKGVLIWRSGSNVGGSAARFRSALNDVHEWGPEASDLFKPDVPIASDLCRQNDHGKKLSTRFQFETDQADMLPISDIRVQDHGGSDELWGFTAAHVTYTVSIGTGQSKLAAGMTCSHILRQYPESKDGEYWIDPNGGDLSDAIKVSCDMSHGGWTNVPPPDNIAKKNYFSGADGARWASTITAIPSLKPKVSDSQLEALQDMSSHAKTRIKFHCKGVIVWRDGSTNKNRIAGAALWFRSNHGIVWGPEEQQSSMPGDFNPVPTVLDDACRLNDNVWREANFAFQTSSAHALPFTDINIDDQGGSTEEFGIEFQPIQFITRFETRKGMSSRYPARTCYDIYFDAYPEILPDGRYWIDPNGGSTSDAIFALCDMKNGGWTGVEVTQNIAFKNYYTGSDGGRVWASTGHPYISYKVAESQLIALQNLAEQARQDIKVICRGVVVWHNPSYGFGSDIWQFWGGRPAARLHWHRSASYYVRPDVRMSEDGCKFNTEVLADTVIHFNTGYPQALPIVDFRSYDVGGSGEQFGVDFEPVWFK